MAYLLWPMAFFYCKIYLMKKYAVIIYGAPGSGKTMQADLLSRKLGILHFDIGHFLEDIFKDENALKDERVSEQKHVFESGGMCDPLWIVSLVSKRFKEIANSGSSLILSGSLRTVLETFGHEKMKGLIDILEEGYGKENIYFYFLDSKPETSIKRNKNRLICSICGRPVLAEAFKTKPVACPICGGELNTRALDKPEIIKKRLLVFHSDTKPVLEELTKRGYKITHIEGERKPYEVEADILKSLNHDKK
ncbi:MAG: nucleoside monophosphate kinase [Candidatus Pacebacteria bacterium]|nr:nucleoside monophosphate kinase [Candidatus Paceibacterota bacterium]